MWGRATALLRTQIRYGGRLPKAIHGSVCAIAGRMPREQFWDAMAGRSCTPKGAKEAMGVIKWTSDGHAECMLRFRGRNVGV